jgi:hypothetical protein
MNEEVTLRNSANVRFTRSGAQRRSRFKDPLFGWEAKRLIGHRNLSRSCNEAATEWLGTTTTTEPTGKGNVDGQILEKSRRYSSSPSGVLPTYTTFWHRRALTLCLQITIGLAIAGLLFVGGYPLDHHKVHVFAALNGTSAWLYVGWAVICGSLSIGLLNLTAAVGVFVFAVLSIRYPVGVAAAGFVFHSLWSTLQLFWARRLSPTEASLWPGWISLNAGLAVLLFSLSNGVFVPSLR